MKDAEWVGGIPTDMKLTGTTTNGGPIYSLNTKYELNKIAARWPAEAVV